MVLPLVSTTGRRARRAWKAIARLVHTKAPILEESPWKAEVLSREALQELAIRLAREHRDKVGLSSGTRLLSNYRHNCAVIDRVYERLSEAAREGDALTAGGEWLLDNYHVVERHIAAIKRFLPRGYYRTLPKFKAGPLEGFPRVYHLALEFIIHSDAVVDPTAATFFINAYQREGELNSGELWAFPIMLRFALFENLSRLVREAEKELLARHDAFAMVDEVLGDESRPATEIMVELAARLTDGSSFFPYGTLEMLKRLRTRGRKAYLALQFFEELLREKGVEPEELLKAEEHSQAVRQISVGNTMTSLTAIDQISWREWFESVSLVHATLERDPAQIYSRDDFDTRDRLRHHVERIAKRFDKSESKVAAELVECAAAAPGTDPRPEVNRYVGYYVTHEGLPEYERWLGIRPPRLVQIGRVLMARALPVYLFGIVLFTTLVLGYVMLLCLSSGASWWGLAGAALLAILPATDLGASIVQYLVTRIVPPRPLPKLDYDTGIPQSIRTVVTVHTIFNSPSSVARAVDTLEVRFLANDDPGLTYILLADLPDASAEHLAGDEDIIGAAASGISALNERHGSGERTPFMLFFRRRLWNPSESKWMGWERKRGKIEEFNRLLLGDESTTLEAHVGDPKRIVGTKVVITLDSDSELPRDAAKKLVATISHPLNRPVFDPRVGRVTKGYGLIQPRVSISLTAATASRFAQLFAGHAGLDPYTNVVSDVYQDLFGEGSYVGKGVYDVEAFEQAMHHRVPENSLLSHDLFESSFVRTGLASDIEVFDDFPTRYVAYAKRLHRWVRGDWQLLPWLGMRVPSSSGRAWTQLSALGWWKIIDNLRRSLIPISLFTAVLASWLVLPGSPLLWVALAFTVLAFPVFAGLAGIVAWPSVGFSFGGLLEGLGRDLLRQTLRAAGAFSVLPHSAAMMVHAAVVTCWRVFVSRKNLLEWETAERAERRAKTDQHAYTRYFAPAMGVALACALGAAFLNPAALLVAVPVLVVWGISPFVSRYLTRPVFEEQGGMSADDAAYLVRAAHDIWSFFDDHLVAEHRFLMPDNLQLVPTEVVADRTSPTNISLSFLSVISAYDLGFIPLFDAVTHGAVIIESVSQLEKYRGHLFNWYATRTGQPLNPRYISTVDSGNFLGHLYVLEAFLESIDQQPLVQPRHARALLLLAEDALSALTLLEAHEAAVVVSDIEQVRVLINGADSVTNSAAKYENVYRWFNGIIGEQDLVARIVARSQTLEGEKTLPVKRFARMLERVSTLGSVVSWLPLARKMIESGALPVPTADQVKGHLDRLSALPLSIENLEVAATRILAVVRSAGGHDAAPLERAVSEWTNQISALRLVSADAAHRARVLIDEMDLGFLYDGYRNLFAIGFNIDHARRDGSFYDLLASEARLTSFIAVAKGVVPQKHWFSLGRSLANTDGGKALVSWSGTMFEYLMPNLVMQDYPTSLLGRTVRAVVRAQMRYGKKKGVPWGISESAYAGVDFEKTYQYRAFGVPGLGLKRGLSEDLVVSPYSTFLALPFSASVSTATENLKALAREGGCGRYGFFEAIDYTRGRAAGHERHHVVQSFFAHHQGMSLVAINNLFNEDVLCRRFHSHPIVRAAELLLQERFPERIGAIVPHEPEVLAVDRKEKEDVGPGLEVITTPFLAAPRVRILSNGRYTVLVDSAGGGFSSFEKQTLLTRWREDSTSCAYGTFFYLRDRLSGQVWSTAYHPTKVEPSTYEAVFSPGRAEFKRVDDQIFVHTDIAVAPEDDVELRRLTITNLGDSRRVLDVVSYLEPALASRRADAAHPAFSKLFVRAEAVEGDDAIVCTRRPRTESEKDLFFFHRVTLHTAYAPVAACTSRTDFIGRGETLSAPALLSRPPEEFGKGEQDVDPLVSLRVPIEIEPGQAETIIFVSGAARTESDVHTLRRRYRELTHVSRAFELAMSRAQIAARNNAYSAGQVELFHRLGGCLYYNEPAVRGFEDALSSNRLGQSGLWRFGISGDISIVLLEIDEPRQIKVLQELLLCHHFLRERGIEFDLVVLHHYPGGYMQQLKDELEYAVRVSPSGYLLDRPGGVFLRSTSQVSESEGNLLRSVARVVLNGQVGGLTEHFRTQAFETEVPGPAPASRAIAIKSAETTPPDLVEWNGIGGFSSDGCSYVLPSVGAKRPPLPWSNVVANPHFGFLVTESGAGYTWAENSRENRLTVWSNDPVTDTPSEVLYVRDTEMGHYWSLTPEPSGSGLAYRVEHAFGSSSFSARAHDLTSKLVLSCSSKDKVKWFSVELTNHTNLERKLELYLYADLVMGVTRDDSYRFIASSFQRATESLCFVNHYNNEFAGRIVAVGCSEPLSGYTASRLEFLGRHGELARPAVLERVVSTPFLASKSRAIKLSGRVGAGFDPCAALQVPVTIGAGETKEVVFYLAERWSLEDVRSSAPAMRSVTSVRAERRAVQEQWNELLSTIEVKTPSLSFDLMMNGWLLYQTVSCRLLARSAFYQSGGALGFRDQLQDSLALLPIRPDLVREQILLHAARQFVEGDVQHWWHPPTGRGVRTRISDDLLWLPYAVGRYVDVTGDLSIVHEQVPFLSGPALGPDQMENYFVPDLTNETASVLEHCLRTLRITESTGSHGLPLIGCGDWNDGMNEVGRHLKGESVWLAWFQIEVLKHFIPVLRTLGLSDLIQPLEARVESLRNAAEAHAWDGSWYRRAYYDDGTPLGSATSDECQIDSLAQSWGVISGAADSQRSATAMTAVFERLVDREGGLIKLLTPAFDKTEKNPGYIKGYPPGIRENGGQYTHAAAWVVIACAMMGRGSDAFSLFNMINPINHATSEEDLSVYKAEPYVLCGDVYSEAPFRGRAGWSWYTGSSGWLYQAGLEHILGIRVLSDRIELNPCVPKDWTSFAVSYKRGATLLEISFDNSVGVEHGVKRVLLDGVELNGAAVPLFTLEGKERVGIVVVMG